MEEVLTEGDEHMLPSSTPKEPPTLTPKGVFVGPFGGGGVTLCLEWFEAVLIIATTGNLLISCRRIGLVASRKARS